MTAVLELKEESAQELNQKALALEGESGLMLSAIIEI